MLFCFCFPSGGPDLHLYIGDYSAQFFVIYVFISLCSSVYFSSIAHLLPCFAF
jgi:hypothetical protein